MPLELEEAGGDELLELDNVEVDDDCAEELVDGAEELDEELLELEEG
jgi:hypothetical protein